MFLRVIAALRPQKLVATVYVGAPLLMALAKPDRSPELHPHVRKISLDLHDLREYITEPAARYTEMSIPDLDSSSLTSTVCILTPGF